MIQDKKEGLDSLGKKETCMFCLVSWNGITFYYNVCVEGTEWANHSNMLYVELENQIKKLVLYGNKFYSSQNTPLNKLHTKIFRIIWNPWNMYFIVKKTLLINLRNC